MKVDPFPVTQNPDNIRECSSEQPKRKRNKLISLFICNARNTAELPGFVKRVKDFFTFKSVQKEKNSQVTSKFYCEASKDNFPAVQIENLPPEMIREIAYRLTDVIDYANFSRTCRGVNNALTSLSKLHDDYAREKQMHEGHERTECKENCVVKRNTNLDKLFAFTEVTDFTLDILKNTTLYYVAENFYIKTRMSVNDFNKDNCKVFNRMRDALIDEPMNHELEGGPVESKKELFWKYELKLNFHEITEENIKSYFSVFHNLHNQVEGGEKFIIAHFASKVKEGLRKKLHGTINENYINKLVSLYPELFNSAAKVRYILDSSQQKLVQE